MAQMTEAQTVIVTSSLPFNGELCLTAKRKKPDMKTLANMLTEGWIESRPHGVNPPTVKNLFVTKSRDGEIYFIVTDLGKETAGFDGPAESKGVPAPAPKPAATPKGNGMAEGFQEDPPKAAEGEEAPPRFRSGVMKVVYHDKYMSQGGNNGDNVSVAMYEAFMVEDDEGVAKLNAEALKTWAEQYGCWVGNYVGLNPGMQRMNVGNRIRARIRKGEEVILNGKKLTI